MKIMMVRRGLEKLMTSEEELTAKNHDQGNNNSNCNNTTTTALLAKKKSLSPTFTHTRVFYYDAIQCHEQCAVLNCASSV